MTPGWKMPNTSRVSSCISLIYICRIFKLHIDLYFFNPSRVGYLSKAPEMSRWKRGKDWVPISGSNHCSYSEKLYGMYCIYNIIVTGAGLKLATWVYRAYVFYQLPIIVMSAPTPILAWQFLFNVLMGVHGNRLLEWRIEIIHYPEHTWTR